jgi:hypothetical protein
MSMLKSKRRKISNCYPGAWTDVLPSVTYLPVRTK